MSLSLIESAKRMRDAKERAIEDSQEKLDIDARIPADEYWHCEDVYCDDCPAKIDGKTPKERYNTGGCETAKCVEILARQRKLDSES